MKKTNLILVLMMIFCFSMNTVSLAMDGDFREKKPRLVVIQPESIPEVVAGGNFDLVFTVENDSEHNAFDLRVTPNFEEMPLVFEKPQVYEREKSLRARQTDDVSFSFKVSDDAKIGVYGLKLKLEYTNVRDENYDTEQTFYFKVAKEKVKPIINISNISTGERAVHANNKFPLNFALSNTGEVDASKVEVTLGGLSENGFMAVDSNDYKYVGNLKNGENVIVNFDMFASENIKKGTNTLTVNVKYKDTSDNDLELTKTIYVNDVKSENEVDDGDETAAKPKIIISSYNTNPNAISAGSKFNFAFNFKNTSKDKKLRNMKITVSATDGAFIITRGSNTFYIEELDKSAEESRVIELRAKQDLTSNSYPLILAFDYEDFSGNQYTASETINIPVTEYSKLVINSVYADTGYVGSNMSISFDYINMGKATVSNLTASVEGDFTSVNPINYIGNLAAGSSDFYDIEVTPTKEGANYGVLVLAFEDSSGGIIEVKKDFEGYAMTMPTFEDNSMINNPIMTPDVPIEEAEEPVATWIIVVSGIGAFLVMFIITKAITTKIVRKKLEDEI